MATRQLVVGGRVCVRGQKSLGHAMIEIHRCTLTDGVWQRVERHHTTRGFASMLEATEYAEALNAKTWERFDWLRGPAEAYLAFRD